MNVLLAIIGFLGVIAGIILLVLGLIKKKKYKGGLIALVSLVVIFIGILITPTEDTAIDDKENKEVKEEEEAEDLVSENEANIGEDPVEDEPADNEIEEEKEPIELTPQQQMIQNVLALIDSKQAFDAGSYTKGDIPTGEYAFIPFQGSGKYFSERDLSGNIIDNENFDSFGYVYVHDVGNIETNGVLVKTESLQTLGVSGAKELYEIINNLDDFNQAGWYKVGVDIPAGQYVIESFGEGYVAIMSGPVGNSEIVDNEIFIGRYTINVTDGQFLKVSSGTITK